jgi:hypothetical protein
MHLENSLTGDAGHIGLELLESAPPETEQKCYAIEKSVREGYLSLDEALDAYEVEKQDFINFLLNIVIINRHQLSDKKTYSGEEALRAFSMLGFILSGKLKKQQSLPNKSKPKALTDGKNLAVQMKSTMAAMAAAPFFFEVFRNFLFENFAEE